MEVTTRPAEEIAKAAWNAEADEFNQWDQLSQDEKEDAITKPNADFSGQ